MAEGLFSSNTSKKFSIAPLIAPQQVRPTIGADMNNLITTVSNFGKVLADEKTKNTYLQHDEALQLNRKALQDNLYNAGEDLEAINSAYATWEQRGNSIVSSGELSQEGQVTLGKSFMMHREMFGNTIRGVSQGIKKKQFSEDFTSTASTILSLDGASRKDMWNSFTAKAKELKLDVNDVAKEMYGTVSSVFATQLKDVALTATPFEIKTMIDEFDASMLAVDKKLEGKDYVIKTKEQLERAFLAPAINAHVDNLQARLMNETITTDAYKEEVQGMSSMVTNVKLNTLMEAASMKERQNQERHYGSLVKLAMQAEAPWEEVNKYLKLSGASPEEVSLFKKLHGNKLARAEGEYANNVLKQGIQVSLAEIQDGSYSGDPKGLAQALQQTKGVLSASDLNYIVRADFQASMNTDPAVTFSKGKEAYPTTAHSDYDKGADRYANQILVEFMQSPNDINLNRYLNHTIKTGKGGNNEAVVGAMLSTESFKATKTAPGSEEYLKEQGGLAQNLNIMGNMVSTIALKDPLMVDKVFNSKQIQRYEGLKTLMDMGELTPVMIDKLDNLTARPEEAGSLSQKDSTKLFKVLAENGVMPDEYSKYMKQAKVMFNLTGDTSKYLDTVENKLAYSGVYGGGRFNIKGAKDTDGSPLVISKANENTIDNMFSVMRGDVTDFRDALDTNTLFGALALPFDLATRGAQDMVAFKEGKGNAYPINATLEGKNAVGAYKDVYGFRYDKNTDGIMLQDKDGRDLYYVDVTPREFISIASKTITDARSDALTKVFSFEGSMQQTYESFKRGVGSVVEGIKEVIPPTRAERLQKENK